MQSKVPSNSIQIIKNLSKKLNVELEMSLHRCVFSFPLILHCYPSTHELSGLVDPLESWLSEELITDYHQMDFYNRRKAIFYVIF